MRTKQFEIFNRIRIFACLIGISMTLSLCAQDLQYSIIKKEFKESKRKKSYSDKVGIDSSGTYYFETWQTQPPRWGFNQDLVRSAELIKYSNTDDEVFRHDFTADLDGKSFYNFYEAGNGLYMIATSYTKKPVVYTLFIAKINKGTGQIERGFTELIQIPVPDMPPNFNLEFLEIPYEKGVCIKVHPSLDNNDERSIILLDKNLEKKEKFRIPVDLSRFEIKYFFVTTGKDIIYYLAEYDYYVDEKKRNTRVFKRNTLFIWKSAGRELTKLYPDGPGMIIKKAILFQATTGKIIFGGTYSAGPLKKEPEGYFFSEIDIPGEKINILSKKEYDFSTTSGNSFAEETDKKIHKYNEGDEWTRGKSMVTFDKGGGAGDQITESIIQNPRDGSFVMFTQSYKYYTITPDYTDRYSKGYSFKLIGDIVAVQANAAGIIGNIGQIHKAQSEYNLWKHIPMDGGESNLTYESDIWFSSFYPCFYNNKLLVFFNDHILNTENTEVKMPVRAICNYMIANALYCVEIDLISNSLKRYKVIDNTRSEISLPSFANQSGNKIFMNISDINVENRKYMMINIK